MLARTNYSRPVATRLIPLGLIAVLAVVLLSGCARKAELTPSDSAPSSSAQTTSASEPATSAMEYQKIDVMDTDQRKSELPKGFPVEVPVPNGKVIDAREMGQDVWYYEMKFDEARSTVNGWYMDAYSAAKWTPSDGGAVDGGQRVVYDKGNASSEIILISNSDGTTTVRVAIGLGVPVQQTY